MRFSMRLPALLILFCLFSAGPAARMLHAQSADTAGLEVDVTDASGALVPGAKLVLINHATQVTRDGVTGKDGRYRFADIPIGDYTLTIDKEGFNQEVESGISLSVAQDAKLPVALQVLNSQEAVTVTADTAVVDTNRTTTGETISTNEIENLPSNGRNFSDFALTVPGVTPQATSGQGSGISVNGQRGRSNNIMIDGVENNGDLNGTVRQTLSQDAIAQFQVMTNQFLPEYGNAGGGLINVVTKTGTSNFHGDLFYFGRRTSLNAHPYCFIASCPNPFFVQNDFGATLGGPIGNDKTVFFAAVEYQGLNTNLVTTISPATIAGINAILAVRPLVGGGVKSVSSSNTVPITNTSTLASLRVDHTFSARDTFTLRLLYGHYDHNNPTLDRSDGSLSDVSNYGFDTLQAYNATAIYTHVFSPNMLNELHAQASPQHLIQVPNDPTGPAVFIGNNGTSTIAGTPIEFGRNTDFPTLLNENHYEVTDAISWSHGKHLIKFGVDVDSVRANSSFPTDFAGVFDFTCVYSPNPGPGMPVAPTGVSTCVDSLEAGASYEYTQGFGQPKIFLPDWLTSGYIEDSWKILPRLTLNYGLRYDVDLQPQGYNNNLSDPIEAPLPKGIPRDFNNFAPRAGLAWTLDKSGKTVIRAGFGIFYDKIFLLVARNTLLARNTLNETTVAAATQQFLTGPFAQSSTYPSGQSVTAPSINTITSIMPIPYAQQADLYVDRDLGDRWSLELGYVTVQGAKMLKSSDVNLGPPIILTPANAATVCACTPSFQQTGRPYYGASDRLNPSFNLIEEVGSWGHSRYNAFQGTIGRQVSNGLTLRSSWIWSKELDDASDFTQAQQADNPYNPHAERSLGDEDQRNRFVGAAVYRFPYTYGSGHRASALQWVFGDWVGSSIATVFSGSPYDITVGSDVNADGNSGSDRPYIGTLNGLNGGYIVKRNDLRGPRQQNVSFRLQKRVPLGEGRRLEFTVESFNTFNHANFNAMSTTWGTGTGPGNVVWGTPSKSQNANVFGTFTSTSVTSTTLPGQRELQLGAKLFF
jgi:hypothetical protein